jgi:hypothetical protein
MATTATKGSGAVSSNSGMTEILAKQTHLYRSCYSQTDVFMIPAALDSGSIEILTFPSVAVV